MQRTEVRVIVVWGFRVRRKTLSTGTFFSPATGKDGPYRLVQARRWFTFFWIPLIPLKVIGTYVECGESKKLYEPSVLDLPTNASLTEQLGAAAREVAAAIVSADGAVPVQARAVAVEVVAAYAAGYDKETLRADIGRVATADLPARLAVLHTGLAQPGKERFLGNAARLLAASGDGDGARAIVDQVGRELGLSPAHVRGVVATALDGERA